MGAELVKIEILDPNFKLVWEKELSAGETVSGVNSLTWNAVNGEGHETANGLYLLRITTKNKSIVKKISLIR